MSDRRRQYRAIRKALKDLYPFEPRGNLARHLNTLAALISGIVSSKRTNLPQVASKVPDDSLPESRIKRFSRWTANDNIELEMYFLPYAEMLLRCLANGTLVLVMDGSAVGRNCVTLMLSVVYKKRTLPVAWIVIQGKKGHFPEESHMALLDQVHSLVPEDTEVIFLGDGEFDGIRLQAKVDGYGWHYVCSTAKNTVLAQADEKFSYQSCGVTPGDILSFPQVLFTAAGYGPVHAIAVWQKGYKEPLYLVTNLHDAEEAWKWYRKRFRIETFFSDQKSRGFYLHKSHLSDPKRLSRLMIAAALAYIWIIYLGVIATQDGWQRILHRTNRCDLSLFQLGLRLLDHFFNEEMPIPVAFCIGESNLLSSKRKTA